MSAPPPSTVEPPEQQQPWAERNQDTGLREGFERGRTEGFGLLDENILKTELTDHALILAQRETDDLVARQVLIRENQEYDKITPQPL